MHAVMQHGQQAPNNIYLVVQVTIGGRHLRALLDTGAQPCVVKKSLVPLGTPIQKHDLILNGINGPSIKAVGTAQIPLEIGQICFTHHMVVVNDQDLRFPEDTDVIIGADMLISNQLDISTSRWGLVQQEELLENFEPSVVKDRIYEANFTQAEKDYIQNSAEFPEHGLEDEEDNAQVNTSPCSSSRGYNAGAKSEPQKQPKKVRFARMHPEESLPNAKYYTMATLATIDLPASNMTFVKTSYLDENGYQPHHKTLLDIRGGYIAPGIVRINGVAGPKDSIAIMNCTKENFILRKGEPFGSAYAVEEDDLLYIENENVNNLNITSPQVINLMTVASITEEAYVEVQELDSEPDDLNEALEYNPA